MLWDSGARSARADFAALFSTPAKNMRAETAPPKRPSKVVDLFASSDSDNDDDFASENSADCNFVVSDQDELFSSDDEDDGDDGPGPNFM